MIIGIISLIAILVGIFMIAFGSDNDYLLMEYFGVILTSVGFVCLIAFIDINQDIITQWFKI